MHNCTSSSLRKPPSLQKKILYATLYTTAKNTTVSMQFMYCNKLKLIMTAYNTQVLEMRKLQALAKQNKTYQTAPMACINVLVLVREEGTPEEVDFSLFRDVRR